LPRFIANAEGAGFSALRHRLYWYSLLALPLLFSAMVFMAASFSLRLARLGGVPQLVLAAVLSGFGVYFLGEMTRALGQSRYSTHRRSPRLPRQRRRLFSA